MKPLLLAVAISLTGASVPAFAMTDKEKCEFMVPHINKAADSASEMAKAMAKLSSTEQVLGGLGPDVRTAAVNVDQTTPITVVHIRKYISALQDLSYQLQRCAR